MRKTYFSLPTFERYRMLAKQTTPSTDRDLSLGVVLHLSYGVWLSLMLRVCLIVSLAVSQSTVHGSFQ